jgi:hypothetical protein
MIFYIYLYLLIIAIEEESMGALRVVSPNV